MDIWDASQGASCATVGDTDGAAVGFSVQMPQRMGQMVCQRGLSDASLHMCAVFGLHRTGSSCLPKQSVGLDVGLLLGPAVGLAVGLSVEQAFVDELLECGRVELAPR